MRVMGVMYLMDVMHTINVMNVLHLKDVSQAMCIQHNVFVGSHVRHGFDGCTAFNGCIVCNSCNESRIFSWSYAMRILGEMSLMDVNRARILQLMAIVCALHVMGAPCLMDIM